MDCFSGWNLWCWRAVVLGAGKVLILDVAVEMGDQGSVDSGRDVELELQIC
jgi:hypothetical protein